MAMRMSMPVVVGLGVAGCVVLAGDGVIMSVVVARRVPRTGDGMIMSVVVAGRAVLAGDGVIMSVVVAGDITALVLFIGRQMLVHLNQPAFRESFS